MDKQTKVVCILVKMAASFTIQGSNVTTNLPADASVSGSCGDKEFITWHYTGYTLTFKFTKAKDNVYVSHISFQTAGKRAKLSGKMFDTNKAKSYQCNAQEKHQLHGDFNATMTVHDVKLQAYRTTDPQSKNTSTFAEGIQCDADHHDGSSSSNIVPMAVGIAVAVLIVIIIIVVVIVCTIRERGYESV